MKNILKRLSHTPSTLLGVALLLFAAWLHFSGRVLIGELTEFVQGAEALIVIVAAYLFRYMPKQPQGFAPPAEEEPEPEEPETPFPNPTTPRPPKK